MEKSLKRYIGAVIQVSETAETVHIEKNFPDEYKGSEDTKNVRGTSAKAKANLIVRKSDKGKLSLYDVVNIKKETEAIFEL